MQQQQLPQQTSTSGFPSSAMPSSLSSSSSLSMALAPHSFGASVSCTDDAATLASNNESSINNSNNNNTTNSISDNIVLDGNNNGEIIIGSIQKSLSPTTLPSSFCCTICSFQGADLRLLGGCACAFHVRCIDLIGLVQVSREKRKQQQQQQQQRLLAPVEDEDTTSFPTIMDEGNNHIDNSSGHRNEQLIPCPVCLRQDNHGVEIIPLCMDELDAARGGAAVIASDSTIDKCGGEVMNTIMVTSSSNTSLRATETTNNTTTRPTHSSSSSHSQFYDPSSPRTGRWTDEESSFRDLLIHHFDAGSLPLANGMKLNDFLSSILKSKQSRLTKKMKHAKLSTKYFRIQSGYLRREEKEEEGEDQGSGQRRGSMNGGGAKTFSRLQEKFIKSITDPIERSEIAFHMQREWREHLAKRLTSLRIRFDATSWLSSVDALERRVAFEKNRFRMAKRRSLMGKAMEKDARENMPGVFINQRADDTNTDTMPTLSGSNVKVRRIGDCSVVDGTSTPSVWMNVYSHSLPQTAAMVLDGNNERVVYKEGKQDEDGDFDRFIMSMLDEAPIALSGPAHLRSNPPCDDSASLPSVEESNPTLRSSCDPNFRCAAPFLAGITSYMERHAVPFEHIDVWVPSKLSPNLEGALGPALLDSMMGSGGNHSIMRGLEKKESDIRLHFAGSATLGVQIIDSLPSLDDLSDTYIQTRVGTLTNKKTCALTGDEVFNLSMFGQYSSKFSFSPGFGLPGRVFKSGVAAWEQFVANAPPEMFERRGGAIQFGINTAVGLPVECENVGRMILVMYSKYNREKDEDLVNRMVRDIRLFNPCPRWRLVVDMNGAPDPLQVFEHSPDVSDSRNEDISHLVTLLQEQMPLGNQSLLGAELNSIMTLRMILLKAHRTPEEEQLIDMMLVLFKSYVAAGRMRLDIVKLLTRDFDFHVLQFQHQQIMLPQQMETFMPRSYSSQQDAVRQQMSLFASFNTASSASNINNFEEGESPRTTAAPPGTYISSSYLPLPGNFPTTPFT